jgi:hypothetical protein
MRILYTILSILIVSIALVSCSQEQEKAEVKQVQDSLLMAQQDSLLNVFMSEFESISQTVNEVNAKNGIYSLDTSESNVLSKESIIGQVENLDQLLQSKQNQLNDLFKRMKESKVRNEEMEGLISSMQESLSNREAQINELMTMLANKDVKIDDILNRVDSMRVTNIELTEEVIKMDEELHMIYYVVGNAKELKDKGITTKEDGILGIGASKKLDVSKLDLSLFTESDERDLLSVPIYSKKAKLITNHPEASYSFVLDSEEKVETLSIVNRKSFWAATDILVVEVSI